MDDGDEEEGYIIERNPTVGGIRELRKKNTVGTRIGLVTKFKKIYTGTNLLGLGLGQFFLSETSLSLLFCHLNPL